MHARKALIAARGPGPRARASLRLWPAPTRSARSLRDLRGLCHRQHQRPARLDEDRPVRRRGRRCRRLPGCLRLRLRHPGAPHVRRDHERKLRRPDLLAGSPSPQVRPARTIFDWSFQIGTALAGEQSGLHTSVSPDDGNGGRMSYLRFEDQVDGVHVFFDDATNPGPLGRETTSARPTSQLSAGRAPIRSGSRSTSAPARRTTSSRSTSTACSCDHRHDVGGLLPLRRWSRSGTATWSRTSPRCCSARAVPRTPGNFGNGFLVDGVSLASSVLVGPPTSKDQCKNGGWQTSTTPPSGTRASASRTSTTIGSP